MNNRTKVTWSNRQIESLLIWWIVDRKGSVEAADLKKKCTEIQGKKLCQAYAVSLFRKIKEFFPNSKVDKTGTGRGMVYSVTEETIKTKYRDSKASTNQAASTEKKESKENSPTVLKKEYHTSEEKDLLTAVAQIFLLGNGEEMRMPSLQAALYQNSFNTFNLSATVVENILKEYSCIQISSHSGISTAKLTNLDKDLILNTLGKWHVSTWNIAELETLSAFQEIEGIEVSSFMNAAAGGNLYTVKYRDFISNRDKIIDELVRSRKAFIIDSTTGVFPVNEQDFMYFKFATQVAIARRQEWRKEPKNLDKGNMNTRLANLIFRTGEERLIKLL